VSELGLSRRSCCAADWERRTDHHESREWTPETNACLAGDGGPLETANVAIQLERGKDSAAEMRVLLRDRWIPNWAWQVRLPGHEAPRAVGNRIVFAVQDRWIYRSS